MIKQISGDCKDLKNIGTCNYNNHLDFLADLDLSGGLWLTGNSIKLAMSNPQFTIFHNQVNHATLSQEINTQFVSWLDSSTTKKIYLYILLQKDVISDLNISPDNCCLIDIDFKLLAWIFLQFNAFLYLSSL